MRKFCSRKRTRSALTVCAAVLCSFLYCGSVIHADEGLPIPKTKPVYSPDRSTAGTGKIVRYSLGNIRKDIDRSLNSAEFNAPLPAHKPTASTEALKSRAFFDKKQAIPTVLSAKDVELYTNIFALQAAGRMKEADALIRKVKDERLMGYVLAQRYLHPSAYVSGYAELSKWLAQYKDHAVAEKIYTLALNKSTDANAAPTRPTVQTEMARMAEPAPRKARAYQTSLNRSAGEVDALRQTRRQIQSYINQDRLSEAHQYLQTNRNLFDAVEYDRELGHIAAGFLYYGYADQALDLASQAQKRSPTQTPKAAWIAGLSSWHKQDYKKAAQYFGNAARSPYASQWQVSAASFWEARAHGKIGNVVERRQALSIAAKYPRTFYGLISARAARIPFMFNWGEPKLTRDDTTLLLSDKQTARAVALVQVGKYHWAEKEMLAFTPQRDDLRKAILAFATEQNLPAVALRYGRYVKMKNGQHYDSAFYPRGEWAFSGKYEVDPALIHAIIRQESMFDYEAESHSGAKGLMQIMPRTAQFIADRSGTDLYSDQKRLFDPTVNVNIGQSYLAYLMADKNVGGDILSLLTAYNGGPGNLAKWKSRWSQIQDPLFFIEVIPLSETRSYVERVLANYWIYRMQSGQPTPILDTFSFSERMEYADNSKQLLKLATAN